MTLEDALALVKTFRSCAGLPLNPLELDEFDAAKKIRTHFLNQKSGQSLPAEDSGSRPAAPDSEKCSHEWLIPATKPSYCALCGLLWSEAWS